jgi:hypothetical protein
MVIFIIARKYEVNMKLNPIAKLRQFFRFRKSEESWNLEQKYADLYTTFRKIKLKEERLKDNSEIISKIEELFECEKTRHNSNLIEQFLVPLYSENELDMEIKVKLIAGKSKFPDDLWKFYQGEFEILRGDAKQDLLTNMNKHLNRIYDTETITSDYIAKTRIRTSLFFILSILMFFMVDQLEFIRNILAIGVGSKGDFIITSMAAGWMGTSFSILIGLGNRIHQSSTFDLKIIHRVDYILSRALIGMISGLIIFYSFQSGILTGTFFPKFKESVPLLNDANKALLIVWCFVSGFSEKLVPDLLSKVEKNANREDE